MFFLDEYDEKHALANRYRTGVKEQWAKDRVFFIRNFYNRYPTEDIILATGLHSNIIEYIHELLEEHLEWPGDKIAYEYGIEEYFPD